MNDVQLEPYSDEPIFKIKHGTVRVEWLGAFIGPWLGGLTRRYAKGRVVEVIAPTGENPIEAGYEFTVVAKEDRGRNPVKELNERNRKRWE